MAIRVKVDPIDREIKLMINSTLSPEARSKLFAEFAADEIADTKAHNAAIIGREPKVTVTVDGRQGAPLSSVKPEGVIIADFHLAMDVLDWINSQLQRHSPVKTGRYVRSNELFADSTHVENPNKAPAAEEYVFINVQPYARKIERGLSSKAPDGVFQAVATLARARFGNIARISFAYRAPLMGAVHDWAGTKSALAHAARHGRRSDVAEWLRRQPAIIVRPY